MSSDKQNKNQHQDTSKSGNDGEQSVLDQAKTEPVDPHHDAFREIRQQQELLNKAIAQHPDDPEIQKALREQKDALGAEVSALKHEHEVLKGTKDGGGAFASNLRHSGGLADFLASGDAKVRVVKH